jgi:putative peptidoglycan lipid II flippase
MFGFVRIAVIGAIFGAGGEADVLNAVFTIPNNLRKLMAEGALSSAFIPILSKSIVQDPTGDRSRKIVRNIFTLQLIILLPVLFLSVVFSPQIIRIILDFSEPDKITQASRLFRWMIHYLLLISVSAVLMGAINAKSSFFIPAVTPVLFSITVISSILLFHRYLGTFSMVLGVLFGGIAQVLFQLPKFSSLGYDLKPDVGFSNPDFSNVMRQWLPVVATASIYTINEQIAIRFATALEEGSASAMSNALVFWQLPFGIFSASITTVLFPRMSRQAVANDYEGLKATLIYGLRYLMILLIPSALILSLLGREVIAVALQRGNFALEHTILTAKVLLFFNFGLLSVGAFNFLQRFFYSLGDYKTPIVSAVLVCGIDIILSLWLKETFLRVGGLALANTLSFSLGLVLLYLQARRRLGGLDTNTIVLTLMKILLAMLLPAAFLFGFKYFSGGWWRAGSSWKNLGLLSFAGLVSLLLVFVMYIVVKIDIIINMVRKKEIDE